LKQQTVRRNSTGIAGLFVVSGLIQEVGLKSGWADSFLAVAERFDKVEERIWGRSQYVPTIGFEMKTLSLVLK
jgi:hypothetical protein